MAHARSKQEVKLGSGILSGGACNLMVLGALVLQKQSGARAVEDHQDLTNTLLQVRMFAWSIQNVCTCITVVFDLCFVIQVITILHSFFILFAYVAFSPNLGFTCSHTRLQAGRQAGRQA